MKKSEFIRSLLMPGLLASVVLVSASCSSTADEMLGAANDFISVPVSYTHLTLPTRCSV